MEILIIGLDMLRRVLPRIGLYIFLEILLPGGTLLALLLYLYRRRKSSVEQGLLPRSAMAPTGSSPV